MRYSVQWFALTGIYLMRTVFKFKTFMCKDVYTHACIRVCVCMCDFSCMGECPQKSEDGYRSPEGGFTITYKPHDSCVKNWGSFARVVCAPNQFNHLSSLCFQMFISVWVPNCSRIVMSLRWCKHGDYYRTVIMTLIEAAGLVHVTPALVCCEVFSSCTYLVHHPCSVKCYPWRLVLHFTSFVPSLLSGTMRAAFKMLEKSISLFTPMFHLPKGLVIDAWSCHFSGCD